MKLELKKTNQVGYLKNKRMRPLIFFNKIIENGGIRRNYETIQKKKRLYYRRGSAINSYETYLKTKSRDPYPITY